MKEQSKIRNKKIEFIKEHHKEMTYEEMAKQLNCSRANISSIICELIKKNELDTKVVYEYVHDLHNEKWRVLCDIECSDYFISNYGRVKNKDNVLMKDSILKNGYHMIKLFTDNNKYSRFLIHRLVAKYFVENPDPIHKIEVDHINGDKDNNAANNLQWLTPQENTRKAFEMGVVKILRGSEKYNAKPVEDVIKVCELLEDGYKCSEIHKMYPNYNINWIVSIQQRHNWKHISDDYVW